MNTIDPYESIANEIGTRDKMIYECLVNTIKRRKKLKEEIWETLGWVLDEFWNSLQAIFVLTLTGLVCVVLWLLIMGEWVWKEVGEWAENKRYPIYPLCSSEKEWRRCAYGNGWKEGEWE